MTDKSLPKELELFQDLSDREVKAVVGGISVNKPKLGSCPACLSGINPLVLKDNYLEVISSPSST